MPLYDTIGTPAQLGADLNYYSSNGGAWAQGSAGWIDPRRKWDSTAYSSNPYRVGGAENNVDCCFHQGELHVVWVEPEWNGSVRFARGPFVKKWDGAAWVNVGGEVEPAITPSDIRDAWALGSGPGPPDSYPWGVTTPAHATGTTYYPARPRIVSDGTDIFVGYTVRRVTTGDGPPLTSYFTGNSFDRHRVAAGEWTQWVSRWARVRRWDGAAWELYGEIPAQTCNAIYSRGTVIGEYTGYLDLAASSTEPGVVYLTVWESAQTNVALIWDLPVTFFLSLVIGTHHYTGLKSVAYTARFDGGSTSGPVREFQEVTTAVVDSAGSSSAANDAAAAIFAANRASLINMTETRTSGVGGTGFVFWTDITVPELRMELQTDGTLFQTYTIPSSPIAPFFAEVVGPLAIGNAFNLYYVSLITGLLQVPEDGSAGFDDLDGLPEFGAEGGGVTPIIIPDGANNIWATRGWSSDLGGSDGVLMQYHRPCRAWVNHGKIADLQTLYGRPALALDGDTLYYAGAFWDEDVPTDDLVVQVWTVPILRDALSCEGAGLVASIHQTFSSRV